MQISGLVDTVGWAKNGNAVPRDTAEIFDRLGDVCASIPELQWDEVREETTRAAREIKLAALDKTTRYAENAPAVPQVARDAALSVLMCGVMGGALDTALYAAARVMPSVDIPAVADRALDARLRLQAGGLVSCTTSKTLKSWMQDKEMTLERVTDNETDQRKRIEKEIRWALNSASKNGRELVLGKISGYSSHLLELFEEGYIAGRERAAFAVYGRPGGQPG